MADRTSSDTAITMNVNQHACPAMTSSTNRILAEISAMAAMGSRCCLAGVTIQALGRVGLGGNRVFYLLAGGADVALVTIAQVLGIDRGPGD